MSGEQMNRWLRAFCWLVLRLDRIPRYGRTYVYRKGVDGRRIWGPAQWRFQRNGRWGMNLLIDWKLFFRYIGMEDMEDDE
jgi:hypothetical protein